MTMFYEGQMSQSQVKDRRRALKKSTIAWRKSIWDWDTDAIVTMFPKGQRSWSQVKERWRELKKRLVNRKQFKYKSKFREWYKNKTALVSY